MVFFLVSVFFFFFLAVDADFVYSDLKWVIGSVLLLAEAIRFRRIDFDTVRWVDVSNLGGGEGEFGEGILVFPYIFCNINLSFCAALFSRNESFEYHYIYVLVIFLFFFFIINNFLFFVLINDQLHCLVDSRKRVRNSSKKNFVAIFGIVEFIFQCLLAHQVK